MSLFDSYRQAQAAPQRENPVQQLRKNPGATLKQAGFTVPAGMTNPQQIVNYLLQSGQVSNPRLQAAQQMMARMLRR